MGLDLSIRACNIKNTSSISTQNIDIVNVGQDFVEIYYRLNMTDIHKEQSYFAQYDLLSPVLLLSFGCWNGFNGSVFFIENKEGRISYKEGDDKSITHRELSNEEKKDLFSDIENGINFCKKQFKEQEIQYYILYGLTVYQMIKEVIQTPNSELIIYYD
jgi:hypothetical protein